MYVHSVCTAVLIVRTLCAMYAICYGKVQRTYVIWNNLVQVVETDKTFNSTKN